jgi:hypothetical protein
MPPIIIKKRHKWPYLLTVFVFLISSICFISVFAQTATLSVTLDTSPVTGGPAPLTGLTMTAAILGTATGPVNYYFYCSASNDNSTTVIPGYAYSVIGTNSTTITTPAGICDSVYSTIGTYLAKIIVERGANAAEERRTVGVFNPVPAVDLKIRPLGTTDWFDLPIDVPYNSAVEIRWTFFGADSCTMSGDWTGTKTAPGQESTGNLTEGKTYIYTLECSTSSGLLTDTVLARVAPPTLFASFSAAPSLGTAPLAGVILTANVTGGTAIGTINYTFYCNRSDAGINITPDYAYKLDGTNLLTLSAPNNACDSVYANSGTYTAKVIVERSGVARELRTTITVNPPPAPIVDITADSTNIAHNTSTTLRWTVSNATTCAPQTGPTNWTSSGNKTIPTGNWATGNLTGPTNYTYTLTCTGLGGTRSDSVTIAVGAPPPPTVDLTADSTDIAHNTSTTLRWTIGNATSTDTTCTPALGPAYWTSSGNKAVPTGSWSTGNLTGPLNYTYRLTCVGPGGTTSDSVTIGVGGPPPPPQVNIWANDSNGPITVPHGSIVVLNWETGYYGADSCEASGDWSGSKNTVSGQESTGNLSGPVPYGPDPYDQYVYTITCYNAGGSAFDRVLVNVLPDYDSPIVSLQASPASVDYGASTQLSWASENAVSCNASGDWSGTRPISGTASTGNLTEDRSYTLTCTGPGGTEFDSVDVNVGAAPMPTVDLRVNNSDDYAYIEYRGSAALTWTSTNATSCEATADWSGSRPTSGNRTISGLTEGKIYEISCFNAAGDEDYDWVIVDVAEDDGGVGPPTPSDWIIFENPLEESDLRAILDSLSSLIRMIAIGLAGVMVIVSGITILTSIDNRERLNKGKNMLKWALIGLAIALASSFIIGFIEELVT